MLYLSPASQQQRISILQRCRCIKTLVVPPLEWETWPYSNMTVHSKYRIRMEMSLPVIRRMKKNQPIPSPSKPFQLHRVHRKMLTSVGDDWSYRILKFGTRPFGPLTSGPLQLRLLGVIFLCGPGMFAGLTGLGGAGLGNPIPVNNSLIANYAFSVIVWFFVGPISTRLGFRLSLAIGVAACSFNLACLIIYRQTQAGWVLILGGVTLGILSTVEWTAQGTMMMTYPLLQEKGRNVSYNLTMFNLGAVLGTLVNSNSETFKLLSSIKHVQVVFLQNLHTTSAVTNIATYIAFTVIMAAIVPSSGLIVPLEKVTRSDGFPVIIIGSSIWIGVLKNLASRLRTDPHVVILFLMFFVSNFYLLYVFNDINLTTFNIRTRALNTILFYAAGVPGAYSAGYIMDTKRLRRRSRVKIGLSMLLFLFTAVWISAYFWQKPFTRSMTKTAGFRMIDCTDRSYVGPSFLLFALGFVHFVFQNCIYWFMTSLADGSATASTPDFAGFFESLQAVGVAIAWRLSNLELPFTTDLAISWALSIASVLIAAPLLLLKVRDNEENVTSDVKRSVASVEEILV